MSRSTQLILILSVLFLAALACSIDTGGPEPERQVETSTEEAGNLEEAWQQAVEEAENSNSFTLIITESQLTSFLAAKLAEQPDPILTDPQVLLREGEIEILGQVEIEGLSVNASIILVAAVDEDGGPQLDVKSAEVGPFPVPEELLDGIAASINEALSGELGSAATGFQLTGIVISDGVMALSGTIE